MRIIIVDKNEPIEDNDDENIILVSEYNLSYLQGIRDAKGINAILIGSNGAEIQMKKEEAPFYTEYKSIEEAVKGLGYEL